MVGTGTQQLSTEMIDLLYASRTRDSLRNIPSPRKKLSFHQLKIYYDEKGFTVNDSFLDNLDIYTTNNELNYAAYLLADLNNVSIKVSKYSGTDKNDYTREVPPVIEIYADRLTITSYGGLVPGLSKDKFFSGRSMIRNRELMRVYRDLNFVEQLGSGMRRILQAYSKEIFNFSDNFMEVCFKYERDYLVSLAKASQNLEKTPVKTPDAILVLLKENNLLTLSQIADQIEKAVSTVERAAKKLRDQGKLKYVGPQKGGHWEVIGN